MNMTIVSEIMFQFELEGCDSFFVEFARSPCVCIVSFQATSSGKTVIIPAVELELWLFPSEYQLLAFTLIITWQLLPSITFFFFFFRIVY